MRRVLLIFFLMLALVQAFAAPPRKKAEVRPGVSKVEIDSLLTYMREQYNVPVYWVHGGEDRRIYTVYADEKEQFMQEAFRQLRENGYRISEYRDLYIVLYGRTLVTSLPAGFFENRQEQQPVADVQADIFGEKEQQATFANKIYEIGEIGARTSGKASVSGYVRDAATGEPLTGISVYDDRGTAYAQTDASGFYKISLPVGDNTLCYDGWSMEEGRYMLKVWDDGNFDVQMKERVLTLTGAVVTAESMARHRSSKMGIETVRMSAIKNVPAVFGEADVLKVLLTLPGVKSVGEVSNGFNVRGGSSDQNLILFNNGTIYNPSHMFGLMSVFNPDVVSDIELYKSSIPVEYGGRISSVLEVRSREGNGKKLSGSLGIGLLTSRLHLEGPIGNENTTFIIGARTTYSDWMLRLRPNDLIEGIVPPDIQYTDGSASFRDLNIGLTHKFGRNHSLHAYGYISRDKFGFSNDTSYRYDNLNVSLKWRSNFDGGRSMVIAAGYDEYGYRVDDTFNAAAAYTYQTQISQPFAKVTIKSPLSESHTLTYGGSGVLYQLQPGARHPLGEESIVEDRSLALERGLEAAAYVSDEWQITRRLSVDAGLRYVMYGSLNDRSLYHAPEIRISGKMSFTPRFSWKAGFNTMHQYIHKISNSINISPTDTWKLADRKLAPQNGWQAATGLYLTAGANPIDFSLELYYKRVNNFVDYMPGARLAMNENLADELVPTECRAYGVELMMRRTLGKLNGWVSYTWSRSMQREMGNRGKMAINRGEWYCTSYDKPHELKAVLNYKFTHRYSISANVDYSTGRPVTLPIGTYEYAGGTRLVYSDRNAYRIPDYFRLDLALVVEPGHYLRQLAHLSFTMGVYNVTGRHNAYSVYYDINSRGVIKGHMMSVFAYPIPYINFNLEF